MKKLLAVLLLLFTLMLSLFGCASHEVEMENWIKSAWLYEPVKERYESGEEVTVRIKKKEGVGCWLILDAKDYREVVHHHTSTDNYYEFTFTMPDFDIAMDMMIVDALTNSEAPSK